MDGHPTGEMYPGIFPTYSREVADSVQAHHVSIPAFPEEYRICTSADNGDSTRGNDGEPLALSVTRAAARLLPRWEAPQDFLQQHRRRERQRQLYRQRRQRQRQRRQRQQQPSASQDPGARGNFDVRHEEQEERQIQGKGEQDGGESSEGSTPVKARNVSGHAAELLPPPPPPGDLSSAVNKLLTGAMVAPAPASDVFGVKRLPEKVYRGLRKAEASRAKGELGEEDEQEGEVLVGAAKCYVCKLSVAAGCGCGVLALAKER